MIVTGHRGALSTEPENTLRSFETAVRVGCDEIELDLRVTADGQLVVLHDPTVDRTTNGSGAVADLTLAELQALDAGKGQRVPTWAEAAASVDVGIQAEVKALAAIPPLLESLQADSPLAGRTIVTSFDAEVLLTVRRAMPAVATGLIIARPPAAAQVLAMARAAQVSTVLCGIDGLTVDGVAWLHEHWLQVTVWPVPDAAAFARAAELGVDGITTDFPERFTHRDRQVPAVR